MDKFKGTPGPWEIGYFVKSDVFAEGGKKWVATLVSDSVDGTVEDSANAQLIASAPELLEALQTMYNECEVSNTPSIKAMEDARLIINKALGLEAQGV